MGLFQAGQRFEVLYKILLDKNFTTQKGLSSLLTKKNDLNIFTNQNFFK
jgi:hypothetical protein